MYYDVRVRVGKEHETTGAGSHRKDLPGGDKPLANMLEARTAGALHRHPHRTPGASFANMQHACHFTHVDVDGTDRDAHQNQQGSL